MDTVKDPTRTEKLEALLRYEVAVKWGGAAKVAIGPDARRRYARQQMIAARLMANDGTSLGLQFGRNRYNAMKKLLVQVRAYSVETAYL
jgi:hypothetical protein